MTTESKLSIIAISRHRMGSDGRGIRTLVATYGCPLKCKYCINPESWDDNHEAKIMSLEDIYKAVAIDNLYFQATGGGLTFGGGEPLLQADTIKEFVDQYCENWSIAFETSLNVPTDNLLKVLDIADYFYVDIKSMDNEMYEAYTGNDNIRVLENLKIIIDKIPDKFTVRIPLIPNFNTMKDCEKSEAILKEMGVKNTSIFEYVVHG